MTLLNAYESVGIRMYILLVKKETGVDRRACEATQRGPSSSRDACRGTYVGHGTRGSHTFAPK